MSLLLATWSLVIVSGVLAGSTIIYAYATLTFGKKLDELNEHLLQLSKLPDKF